MMQGEIYYLLIKIRRRAMVKKTAKEMLEIAIEMICTLFEFLCRCMFRMYGWKIYYRV